MSFGFGVGDFLAAGKLVWNVYSAYTEAPELFRNFSQEILSLHIVLRKVEDQLHTLGSDGAASGSQSLQLSTKDIDDLKILHDGLQAIMTELDELLKKYRSLEASGKSIDRFK